MSLRGKDDLSGPRNGLCKVGTNLKRRLYEQVFEVKS